MPSDLDSTSGAMDKPCVEALSCTTSRMKIVSNGFPSNARPEKHERNPVKSILRSNSGPDRPGHFLRNQADGQLSSSTRLVRGLLTH